MDLKAVLNNEDKDNDPQNISNSQAKRPPPPPLSTVRPAAYPAPTSAYYNHESPQRYSNPPIAQSPGSHPPPSAHSYTSTPHSSIPPPNYQSPHQRSAPLPSPGPPRSGSLSNSYFPPSQQPPYHASLHRSSTSPLEQTTVYHESPPLSRAIPPPSASHHLYQPHTPLGPPPILRHDSTHSNHTHHESPTPSYQHHRSSSGTSHYMSPPAVSGPSLPPISHAQHSDSLVRRASYQSHPSNQRVREESLSVSPKTVLQKLPRQSPQPIESNFNHGPPVNTFSQNKMEKAKVDELIPIPDTAKSNQFVPQEYVQERSDSIRHNDVHPEQGLKRSIDAISTSEARTPAEIIPRGKRPIPIWAQPKKGLRPMIIIEDESSTNKLGQRPAPVKHQSTEPEQAATFGAPVPGNLLESVDYDRSIHNIVPNDDLTKYVLDFIHQNAILMDPAGNLPLEIEAKVGRLIDNSRDDRVQFPVLTETIVHTEASSFRFESKMTEQYHKTMNKHLNETLVESKKLPPSGQRARVPMEYRHSREIDAFYDLPPTEIQKLPPEVRERLARSKHRPRVRITKDKQTGDVIAKVIKTSIADLNVYCPNHRYDWRVSINIEFQWEGSIDALEEFARTTGNSRGPNRNKDRLSYKHQFCQIDLTQVKVGQGPAFEEISHELEVEFAIDVLRQQAQLAMTRQTNKYYDYMKVFLDNVRILARYEPN